MDNIEHSGQRLWIKTVLQKACAKNAACSSLHEAPSHCLADIFFFFSRDLNRGKKMHPRAWSSELQVCRNPSFPHGIHFVGY